MTLARPLSVGPVHALWLPLIAMAMLVQTANAEPPEAVDAAAPPLAQIEAPIPGSLYVRMGGAQTVEAVISDMLDHVSVDARTQRPFDKVNLKRLKRQLSAKICSVTGGGCNYNGDSMHDAHAGLGISEAEFYGLVEVLRDSLRRHGVAQRERNELLQILAPIKRDVVER
jgi:hemoglobin